MNLVFTISLSVQDLRRQVLWGSTESVRPVAILHVDLAQSKVT
jgi:hypothetical protein